MTQAPILQTAQQRCFHCGQPLTDILAITVEFDNAPQPVCCHGCESVAQTIINQGLSDYYRFRDHHALTATEVVPDILQHLEIYDHSEVQKSFVVKNTDMTHQAHLILEGIVCAACVWLNEQHLMRLPGVLQVSINYSTHRATVSWDNSQIRLSQILKAIADIGYVAHPYDPARQQNIIEQQRKSLLRKIGVAAGLGMQVMVIAVAFYAAEYSGMEEGIRNFLLWTSLVLTLPVYLYAAQPFLQGAWRDLRQYRAGMDVPVATGITLAFVGSCIAVFQQQGDVYFDSVVMFVFFLLSARYLELQARARASMYQDALVRIIPAYCNRITRADGAEANENIAVAELQPGDVVRIYPGETIPSDGVVIEGLSEVDESILSGESQPRRTQPGDSVVGGSINYASALKIRITKTGNDTVLAGIFRLMEQASTEKPRFSILADRIAQYFVIAVLCLAIIVAGYYLYYQPQQALVVTIAVLVVTCPCALSLATPVAMTAAAGALTKAGLVLTSQQALEVFARVNHVVFDKTGTLTEGKLTIVSTQLLDADAEMNDVQQIAAALEVYSEHPIAQAFTHLSTSGLDAVDVRNHAGKGISGSINGRRYYLGNEAFLSENGVNCRSIELTRNDLSCIMLASAGRLLAAFYLADTLRDGAQDIIDYLQARNIRVSILSGDSLDAVRHVASQLGVSDYRAGCLPDAKLKQLRAYQQQGECVIMVGDGVNDAPVLAAADASIAMATAMQISAVSADSILMSNNPRNIATALSIASSTVSIIRQNIGWAIAYNLLALPLAATGLIPPWLAAAGMSASSLLVVGNSLRLLKPNKENRVWK